VLSFSRSRLAAELLAARLQELYGRNGHGVASCSRRERSTALGGRPGARCCGLRLIGAPQPVARTSAAICKLPDSAREIHHLNRSDGEEWAVAYNILTRERDQLYLALPSMADWLPEDHLAWFVLDAVGEMDLSAFYADYRADGWGGAAHDPTTMVALLLYAYCVGVRSSRQIERACHVDVAFQVICAGLLPDHTTIARFRQRHDEALKTTFTSSLRLCAKAGMAGVGLVALDGTKLAAPASMEANVTKDTIDETVEKMFAEVKAAEESEDATFGETRGDEPPGMLRRRRARRRRFKAAKEILDNSSMPSAWRTRRTSPSVPRRGRSGATAPRSKARGPRGGHVDEERVPPGLQRSGGPQRRPGHPRSLGHRRAE
jgi:transposase